MLTVSFLSQGAKILCLGIAVTVSDIYLGQVTSKTSRSTNPQTTTRVSKPPHLVRARMFYYIPCPSRESRISK